MHFTKEGHTQFGCMKLLVSMESAETQTCSDTKNHHQVSFAFLSYSNTFFRHLLRKWLVNIIMKYVTHCITMVFFVSFFLSLQPLTGSASKLAQKLHLPLKEMKIKKISRMVKFTPCRRFSFPCRVLQKIENNYV